MGCYPTAKQYSDDWTFVAVAKTTAIKMLIDAGMPVPVLTTALYARFSSRGDANFRDKLLSAMRYGFGGHFEKSAK